MSIFIDLTTLTNLTEKHPFLKEWQQIYGDTFNGMTYSEQIYSAYRMVNNLDNDNISQGTYSRQHLTENIEAFCRECEKLDVHAKVGLAAFLLLNVHEKRYFCGEIGQFRISSQLYERFSSKCQQMRIAQDKALEQALSNFLNSLPE